jgi:TatD DNase family protein
MNKKPAWVDSHCHLEMLKEDVERVMEQSQAAGMKFCITIGTDQPANLRVKQLCRQFENVYGTLGFHPHGASEFEPEHLSWIREELQTNKKLVAIGECGYDLYYRFSKKEDQARVFESQLNLAVELDLPVVIHSREADEPTREMLAAFKDKNLKGVVHCFTSDREQARFVLDYGFLLSFNGICTFPQSESVREVLKFTPLDRLLLETDSPYLSPVPFRGKPNLPGRVAIVGEYIANYLGISVEQLSQQVLDNTKMLFSRIDYEN